MVQMIINLSEKENKIINLVKAQQEFKNKEQAINFIIKEYGTKHNLK